MSPRGTAPSERGSRKAEIVATLSQSDLIVESSYCCHVRATYGIAVLGAEMEAVLHHRDNDN